jgi:hypothetical protein
MHYQDDLVDMPHRLRLKDGAPRLTLEQRVLMLERRVSELSDALNGITNQLVDVSSSVHDMTHLPGVYRNDEFLSDAETCDESSLPGQQRRRKKTTYVIADNNYPPKPERRIGDDIIIADRDL